MPLIVLKMKEGVLKNSDMKQDAIEKVSRALSEAIGDEEYYTKTTVIIEEHPSENWGCGGKSTCSK